MNERMNERTDTKSLDLKIEQNIKELQALNILIESLDNKLKETQKKKIIARAIQLAVDLHHMNSAIKSKKTEIALLKSQILRVDNELAKYSTIDEQSVAEKEFKKLEDRLLNNNQKKSSLKIEANQLNAVITNMLLKRQRFLATRNSLITKLMAKKQEINQMFNGYSIVTSNNKSVQQPKDHLQEIQQSFYTEKSKCVTSH